jgi:hypothetical protein
MKVVYGTAVVVVVFLLVAAFSMAPAPDTMTFDGVVYQLVEDSDKTARYLSAASRRYLTLMRFETEPNIDANVVIEKKLTAQGGTRVGKGRFWQMESQAMGATPTMTHISFLCVGTRVTMLRFTEQVESGGSFYSKKTFHDLELIVKDVPRPTRRFQTWF